MPTPHDSSPASGLRERKKDQTRRQLRGCAARLFAERGFADTTVADIAACANVSTRTFFRYFDSKEDLLLPDGVELFAAVEDALARRPVDEPPLDAVCGALLATAAPFQSSSLTALTHPLDGTEQLIAARLIQVFAEFEDRLTALVLDRLPEETPDADLYAAVVAGAALGTVRAVLRTRRSRRAAGADSQDALLPQAFQVLRRMGHSAP
ncbi:TetR family transcriptional regulator [Streptomyces sp. Li-HN-5-11]|uniref:TetR family transcriptional regulator n=1 Tax=Streptomyces sp. Li-HN-5-11 TaxID=3075432 RepID=UPI0028A662A1|nr:TetR family transcriptional regulator [Streptomyces sp. Li-HN-5-11]WNM32509.1 TetR family transcriptional regulator [Streptomyces sp. Li-HN-5-11]WOP38741.1 TetR family transcriptional regulator [Streptomyces sp. Li-HN-5-13]